MDKKECCVLIPSLSPDERLVTYADSLLEAGFGCVLVVDDGSAQEYQPIFDRLARKDRCHVEHHDVNHGKGRALRTGFRWIWDHTAFRGVVTADSDGQHTVEDTLNLCALLKDGADELLLGSRDFSKNSVQVPPKSRVGNRITSAVFRVLYGPSLPDTQTGLRAFRREMIPMMLEVTGDRFEYEMNQLIVCATRKIPMTPVGIHTIYHDENKGTHFHPIRDSWRIYKLILGNFFRYGAASIISFLVDYAVLSLTMFWIFSGRAEDTILFLGIPFRFRALVAAPIARLCSAPVNYLLNRNFVFRAGRDRTAVKRYAILCVCSLVVTTLLFGFLDHFVNTAFLHILLKVVIDVAMYFVNYRFQQGWVFKKART
ncbi:MAG: bifunctional glycosyltransferase family 2/GtrA family protein [Clostridia bacterium]|nr:bifunctional glycosyltransferase family 2/GtrA family protein [Clostridia bacterium]